MELSVTIANAAKTTSYAAVEAAWEMGSLRQFITSSYLKPSAPSGRMLRHVARMAGEAEVKRLEARTIRSVDPSLVVSLPIPELAEAAYGRVAARFGWDVRPAAFAKNSAWDWLAARRLRPSTIFHGYEQCALHSMREARRVGAIAVLEQPIVHVETLRKLEADERRRMGVPAQKDPPIGYASHVLRKHLEHQAADMVVVGLRHVYDSMIDSGFPADRLLLIPYGADVQRDVRVPRVDRAGLHILYVGPLHYWKGLHYLIEVVDALQDLDGVSLTIVGAAHDDWREYFLGKIRERPYIRYAGVKPKAEMPAIYASADVLAFPSLVGGIGLACFEAMAVGVPVVTSDGDVVIEDGTSGVCVPARDVAGWVKAMRRLYHDPELRFQLGAAGERRLSEFSWSVYRRNLQRAYMEVFDRREELIRSRVASRSPGSIGELDGPGDG